MAGAAQRPLEERPSRLTVTVIAEEYVEHLPMLVNGPVQVALLALAHEEDLIHVPLAARSSAVLTGFSWEQQTEAKVWTQRNTVLLDTSTPLSASSSMTLAPDSGCRRYQRTAISHTWAGHR